LLVLYQGIDETLRQAQGASMRMRGDRAGYPGGIGVEEGWARWLSMIQELAQPPG
jgi:hypothetical protein